MPRSTKKPAGLSAEVNTLARQARSARLLIRDRATSRLISAIWSAVPLGSIPSLSLSFHNGAAMASVMVHLHELTSFKSGMLPDLIEACMAAGFDKWWSRDYPDFGNRDFMATCGSVRVHIQAWLSSASVECQRVKVGERVEPVYELRCA